MPILNEIDYRAADGFAIHFNLISFSWGGYFLTPFFVLNCLVLSIVCFCAAASAKRRILPVRSAARAADAFGRGRADDCLKRPLVRDSMFMVLGALTWWLRWTVAWERWAELQFGESIEARAQVDSGSGACNATPGFPQFVGHPSIASRSCLRSAQAVI